MSVGVRVLVGEGVNEGVSVCVGEGGLGVGVYVGVNVDVDVLVGWGRIAEMAGPQAEMK